MKFSFMSTAVGMCLLVVPALAGEYTKPPPNTGVETSQAGEYTKPPPNTGVETSQAGGYTKPPPNTGVSTLSDDGTLHDWIVDCHEGQEEQCYDALQSFTEVEILKEIALFGDFVIRATETKALSIQDNEHVKAVDKDESVDVLGWPDKVDKNLRGDSRNLAEDPSLFGIEMVKARELPPLPSNHTYKKVCVVDTGYRNTHEDLPTLNTDANTGDGFSPYDGQTWYSDGHGHGSHCAGTIGAIGGNDKGVYSVMNIADGTAGFSNFFIGKGLTDSGSGSSSGVLAAVAACEAAGADVISLSLGGGGFSQTAVDAYKQAFQNNTLLVAAAGNGGNSAYSYPASYDWLMSVAAVDSNENKASFSQYNDQVEIAAPGVSVKSSISGSDTAYASWSGTSMATPHVAGVGALVWSHFPQCTPYQIRLALVRTAKTKGDGCNNEYGFGIVDAKAAYDLLKSVGCNGVADSSIKSGFQGGCAFDPSYTPPPTPAPTVCNEVPIEVEIKTDSYPGETSWTLKKGTQNILTGGGYGTANTVYTHDGCTSGGTLTFNIADTFGDGICCSYGSGYYKVRCDGVEKTSGGQFGSSETKTFECGSGGPTAPPTASPTAPTTASPTASPTAPPTASPTEPPTTSECTGGQHEVEVEIKSDNYPAETSWTVKKDAMTIISGSQYTTANTVYKKDTCTSGGTLTFNIADTYGDGICCGYGSGHYKVRCDGVEKISGGQFASSETKTFECGSGGPVCESWCSEISIPFCSSTGALHKCSFTGYCDGCSECNNC